MCFIKIHRDLRYLALFFMMQRNQNVLFENYPKLTDLELIFDFQIHSIPFIESLYAGPSSMNIRSPLQWRHNEHDGVSNHQPQHCLLNCFFRRKSKKTSKLRVTGLCAGNSPETGEFPVQMARNAENVSIRSRHHALCVVCALILGVSAADVKLILKGFSQFWCMTNWKVSFSMRCSTIIFFGSVKSYRTE